MTQRKATSEIPVDINFRDAGHALLLPALKKMMSNASRTRSGLLRREPSAQEVEALHDMRVGSRRMRAALSVFARLMTKEDHRKVEREVSRITDALSGVRDLDVQRESLLRIATDLPKNEAYGVERLAKRLAKRRDDQRKKLVKELDKLGKKRFEKLVIESLERGTKQAAARAKKGK